ncbi:sporulation protein YqfD [Paenibacillus cisolokensis]|uniref:sporulation protein YqfD n=1 Tax=Paenibacillus cisolokensis TaxID=1658519 RepID=UPI003D2ADE99
MNGTWMQWMQGIVTIRIVGGQPEKLVNEALAGGLRLWSIRRTSAGDVECAVTVGDLFRLRPYIRKTSCKLRITGRRGFPFWLVKLERRKFFAVGLLMFVAGIYALSSLVWNIDVKGNVGISEEAILKAAEEEGVRPFQWSFRLPDSDVLSKRLEARLPDVAWVSVEKRGTRLTIRVVESTRPESRPLLSPRHLVASTDAVVTEVLVETGRAVVKKNSRVRKGDILISGTVGLESDPRTVVAKGTVRGIVWYEYNIVSPLTRRVKVYTGESKTRWYAVVGNRALQISGFGSVPFAAYETVPLVTQAQWRNWKLPVGKMRERLMEVRIDERELTAEEAKAAGIMQAQADILAKAGKDAKVLAQNLLHEKTDNGKVYMKVLFEVEQSIVTEMPIVQMQGE